MRKATSILIIIILAIISPVLLLVTSIRYNLVTPKFLKHELASRNAYALAFSQLDQQIDRLAIDAQYPITNQELKDLAHAIISETWLRQNIESVFDHAYAWFNAPMGTALSIPIDTRPVKAQLSVKVDELLAKKLPELKPCPSRRIPKEEQGICQFAGLTAAQVKTQMRHAGLDIDGLARLFPDTFDLANPDLSMITGATAASPDSTLEKNREILAKLEEAKAGYHQFRRYFLYAWIAYGVLVAAIIALHFNQGWRGLARWSGILAVSIGVLPLGISLAGRVLVEDRLLPMLRWNDRVPPEVQAVVPPLILDVRDAVLMSVLITGAVLVGLGLAAIIGSHWLRPPALVKK